MKKTAYLAVLNCIVPCVVIMCACTSDEPKLPYIDNNSPPNHVTSSRIRTTEEAIVIAENAISWLDDNTIPNRRTISRQIDFNKGVQPIVSSPGTRASKIDTLMYVINYTNNNGFALISALTNTPALLAVTVNGEYSPNQNLRDNNPGFDIYMESLTDYLEGQSHLLDTTMLVNPDTGILRPRIFEKTIIDTIWIHNIPNRVKVYWGQAPLLPGYFLPNQKAGCAVVAAAMAMSYYGFPTWINLNYLPNRPRITLDWTQLRHHHYTSGVYESCHNITEYPIHERICQLLSEIGYRAQANYENMEVTPVTTANIMSALGSCGYNTQNFKITKKFQISSHLAPNAVLLVYGKNKLSIQETGHMWVCDGVKHYKIRSRYYQSNDQGLTWQLKADDYSQEVAYNFFNWGWDGYKCGYFLDLTFKPTSDQDYSGNVGLIKVWR